MTLRDFGVLRGYLRTSSSTYGLCPFHRDTRPSAYWNPSSIYCFTCAHNFTLREINERFGENLTPGAVSVNKAPTEIYGYQPYEVLFQYNFK